MDLQLVNPTPKYAPPPLAQPPNSGFWHLGVSVAPPVGPPFVRPDPRRRRLLADLARLAAEIEAHDDVRRVTVYRAVLIPPLGRVDHPARFDVAVLIETTTPESLGSVTDSAPCQRLVAAAQAAGSVHAMASRCARSLGEVDRTRQGLFLFNHFVAEDPGVAVALWENLAGWYVAETGLDNSTLLSPVGSDDYTCINHARWDMSLPAFAARQFGKRSFFRYVLGNMRVNGTAAMPILYRLA